MNWKEIEKKYPKAYDIFRIWSMSEARKGYENRRELYDFFDEQKIYMTVYHVHPTDFSFDIANMEAEQLIDIEYNRDDYFRSRLEAEEAAFLKAFELLETK